MNPFSFKFPRRVRIHGGEFGASARAMHRKAALENVLRATIERKTMSTKTTFKRVALVAVAALGIGMVSAVPSNAAPSVAYVTMYDTTNGYQIVGGQATVTLTVDTSTTTSSNTVVVSGVGSVLSAVSPASQPAGFAQATVGGTPTTGSFTVAGAGGQGNTTIVLASSAAGTQTITVTPLLANGSPGTAVTKTITWLAAGTTAVSAVKSTAYIASGITAPTSSTTATSAAKTAQTATANAAANILVAPKDANGATLAAETLSATVTGPGMLGIGLTQSAAGAVATGRALTGAAGAYYINLYGDGTAGASTVTISDGATVLGTFAFTFTGGIATLVPTQAFTNLQVGANGTNGSSTAYAIAVKATDSNGNAVVDGTTVYATSGTTANATISASQTTVSGYAYFAVQGLAAGTSVITFNEAATSPTVSATTTVNVTSAVASTVTLAFDKTSYAPGEKMVLTLTAKNAAGNGIADTATYTGFLATGGLSSNVALQGSTITGTAPTFVGGVATFTLYAPLASGTVRVTGTTGTSANLATAVQSLALSASADVVGDTAAVDAANAATDAANYAADAADAATTAAQEATAAAQAAQDSADAATAAVVALGLRVDTLMASVRAQLTSLSNLLVRIIKKTHA